MAAVHRPERSAGHGGVHSSHFVKPMQREALVGSPPAKYFQPFDTDFVSIWQTGESADLSSVGRIRLRLDLCFPLSTKRSCGVKVGEAGERLLSGQASELAPQARGGRGGDQRTPLLEVTRRLLQTGFVLVVQIITNDDTIALFYALCIAGGAIILLCRCMPYTSDDMDRLCFIILLNQVFVQFLLFWIHAEPDRKEGLGIAMMMCQVPVMSYAMYLIVPCYAPTFRLLMHGVHDVLDRHWDIDNLTVSAKKHLSYVIITPGLTSLRRGVRRGAKLFHPGRPATEERAIYTPNSLAAMHNENLVHSEDQASSVQGKDSAADAKLPFPNDINWMAAENETSELDPAGDDDASVFEVSLTPREDPLLNADMSLELGRFNIDSNDSKMSL
ncbi:hypothetical protein CYMTET_28080 [Cymbomonas tetramitiformis]|uniref:Uncharacterized protein n=1 Tax=Cymbomonas tetramitiformis TaxID=36881 RepID=A0AAE0FNP4_9CHLO|nr:hypothetical protein CYMTET_28080 [Cymbomonas tetramitiformis]